MLELVTSIRWYVSRLDVMYNQDLNGKLYVYRSYKRFSKDSYLQDLKVIPFHVADIFGAVDNSYWLCQTLLRDVIDLHGPIKKRMCKK